MKIDLIFSTPLRGTIFCHNPVTVETTNPKPVASFDETSLGTAPNVGPLDPPLGLIFHGCDCSGFYRLRWHLKHQCFSYAVWIAFPFWRSRPISFSQFQSRKISLHLSKKVFLCLPFRWSLFETPVTSASLLRKKNCTTSSWMRLRKPQLAKTASHVISF